MNWYQSISVIDTQVDQVTEMFARIQLSLTLALLGNESKYWDINTNLPPYLFCLHLPYILFIYTYYLNDALDKIRVPSFSHEKNLEGTGVLANLEFLVISIKQRENNS